MSKLLPCAILAAIPAFAGEYAVLSSGLKIHADRHESSEGTVRLFSKDAVTEFPAALVKGFEQDDYVPPPPAPQAPVAMPAAIAPPADTKTQLRNAAVRSGLPPAFVESVARIESGMRQDAVSPKGAIGVMQLMPATAKALDADPKNQDQNIDAGTRLLRELLLKYDGDVAKALAAYNAGAAAVDRYQGIPPYPETENYVYKVIKQYQQAGGR